MAPETAPLPSSDRGIHVVVILGSVRPGNFTAKAARLVVDELGKKGVSVELVDPATLGLVPPGVEGNAAGAESLRRSVLAATAVVFATPEYHGTFSSVTKLVIENLGFPSALAGNLSVAALSLADHRPALATLSGPNPFMSGWPTCREEAGCLG